MNQKEQNFIQALDECYGVLNELYRPLQLKEIKRNIDNELSKFGLPDDEYKDNTWTDRAIDAINYVEKTRKELYK